MKKRFLTLALALVLTSSFGAIQNTTNAEMYKDFTSDSKGKYLINYDDSRVKNRWANIKGNWYYFDKEGYMVISTWIGNYYLGKDGIMLTNTTTPDGYRVDENGKWIQENTGSWKSNNVGWWYENKDGSYPINQWKLISSKWYYFDGSGYMQTGWKFINNNWYYLGYNGDMKTGWYKTTKENWSYFKSSGEMVSNTLVKASDDKSYIIDSNGYTLNKLPQGHKYNLNNINYYVYFGNEALYAVNNLWIFNYSNLKQPIMYFSNNVEPNSEIKVQDIISNFKNHTDKYFIGENFEKVNPTPEFKGFNINLENKEGHIIANTEDVRYNSIVGQFTIVNDKLYFVKDYEAKQGYVALIGDGMVENGYSFLGFANENGEITKIKRLDADYTKFLNKEIDGFFGDTVIIDSENFNVTVKE